MSYIGTDFLSLQEYVENNIATTVAALNSITNLLLKKGIITTDELISELEIEKREGEDVKKHLDLAAKYRKQIDEIYELISSPPQFIDVPLNATKNNEE